MLDIKFSNCLLMEYVVLVSSFSAVLSSSASSSSSRSGNNLFGQEKIIIHVVFFTSPGESNGKIEYSFIFIVRYYFITFISFCLVTRYCLIHDGIFSLFEYNVPSFAWNYCRPQIFQNISRNKCVRSKVPFIRMES